MAFNENTSAFDIILATFQPTSPYEPPNGHILTFAMNVIPTTASKFRAEFDQAAIPSNRSGPRILELDGYATTIPEPGTAMLWILGLAAVFTIALAKRNFCSSRSR